MKKIKLAQPKYVLPLIVLPFLFLFFYAYKSFGSINKKQLAAQASQDEANSHRINGSIPAPAQSVTQAQIKDKFAAYTERYKKNKDYSAVRSLDPEDADDSGITSLYSADEKRRIDSLKASIVRRQILNREQAPEGETLGSSYSSSPTPSRTSSKRVIARNKHLQEVLAEVEATSRQNPAQIESDEQKQMRVFKQQMNYMDSLQNASNPNYRPKAPLVQPKQKPLQVMKADSWQQDGFNTISGEKPDYFIKAIIDQNLKGYAGTGIRIRLLDDIQVGGNLIPKGTYLYGIVSGFQLQRVEITVTSIMLNQQILPVEISVYDNDGMIGLNVPSSHFREFTKNLGSSSSQGISYGSEENDNKIISGLVTKLFSSTTTAASQLIKKNKVQIKYNTVVYLVSKEEK